MMKIFSVLYAVISYAVFFASFLYAIGFSGNLLVPKGIDSGVSVGLAEALLVNLGLLGLFAVQHTIMARPAFKGWLTKFFPEHLERSTFVIAASLILFLLYWQWRPMTGVVWSVENSILAGIIWAIFGFGWLMVLVSTFLINHFDLFGLRQVYLHVQNKEYTDLPFQTTSLYKIVRHPIMLGFIIAFWAIPHMTVGHLLFAVATTAYIIIGVHFEEHDLKAFLGDDYGKYQGEVPMLCPFRFGKRHKAPE
jgi:protein-S-isoprenylcysteine O-methyltransferase Ste14